MSKLNKTLILVFCIVIVFSVALSLIKLFEAPANAGGPDAGAANTDVTGNNGGASGDAEAGDAANAKPSIPGLTIVEAPEQTKAERPGAFPDPEGDWVKLPDSVNLAEGKPVSAGEVTEVYAANNVVDGKTTTYWESKGYPAAITINLQSVCNIQTVGVRLNPAPLWEPRRQSFEILVSTDGSSFTVVVPDTMYDFTPDTGNIVRVDFETVAAQYVRLNFTANTAGRSNGSQAAEICIYG